MPPLHTFLSFFYISSRFEQFCPDPRLLRWWELIKKEMGTGKVDYFPTTSTPGSLLPSSCYHPVYTGREWSAGFCNEPTTPPCITTVKVHPSKQCCWSRRQRALCESVFFPLTLFFAIDFAANATPGKIGRAMRGAIDWLFDTRQARIRWCARARVSFYAAKNPIDAHMRVPLLYGWSKKHAALRKSVPLRNVQGVKTVMVEFIFQHSYIVIEEFVD